MAKYDRQLIIVFLTDSVQDTSILAQATALNEKERDETIDSEIVTIRPSALLIRAFEEADIEDLRQALVGRSRVSRSITTNSRVYLVGSGDWQHRILSTWSPEEVADLLGQENTPAVKVISIVGGCLGRGGTASTEPEQPECMDSFAALFHRRLKDVWQIRTLVHARVLQVTVVLPSTNFPPVADTPASGQKVTLVDGETIDETRSRGHHRPHSKVKFRWEGEAQRVEWAY